MFVILGPPAGFSGDGPLIDYGRTGNERYRRCRIEVDGHTAKCGVSCPHGVEQDYPTAHLKKYAKLEP